MEKSDNPNASTEETHTVNRRRILRTLGTGATVSALGITTLAGTAAAHDLEVKFQGCQIVFIVVNDPSEFGVLKETILVYDDDAGEVKRAPVELTSENTQRVPNQFGDRPVFAAKVSGNDRIIAVETGDGRTFENPNDCAPQEDAEGTEEPAGTDTPDGDGLPQEVVVAHTDPESVQEAEDYVSYVFEVTGDLEELEPNEDDGAAVDEVIDRGDRVRVEGSVGTGDDRYAFSGELIEVDVPSNVTLEITDR